MNSAIQIACEVYLGRGNAANCELHIKSVWSRFVLWSDGEAESLLELQTKVQMKVYIHREGPYYKGLLLVESVRFHIKRCEIGTPTQLS